MQSHEKKSFITIRSFFALVLILIGILGSFGNIREILAAEPFFVEGNIYTDEGTTLDTTSSRTISLRMATGTPVVMSTTTVDNGFFKFELGVNGNMGGPFIIWVDNDSSFRAAAFSKASTTIAGDIISNINLYQNRVNLWTATSSDRAGDASGVIGTTTKNSDLAWYDNDDDADIQFISNAGTLTVLAGQMLYIGAGTEYKPGGNVILHGNAQNAETDGSLKLSASSTPFDTNGPATSSIFSLDKNSISLAGSWYASSSAIFNSTGTVTLSATTTGKSIYATSTPFYNLAFDGVDGTAGGWTFQENASTTGAFTITDGTVTAPSWLSIAGNFTNNGAFTAGTGTTTFNASAVQTLSGSMTGSSGFNNFEINAGGWPYRKKITLKQASTTLTSFPALVSLSDADLASRAQADGDDIFFTESDGATRLSHEIENYGSGGVNAWVKIPTLSSAAANDIYMYYGNASASNQETPATVWDGSYEAVWHMSESPTVAAPQILDSTANNNDGTVVGTWIADDQTLASSTASGKIGGSLYFTGLLTRDYINAGSSSSVDLNDKLTASIWVKGGDQSQDTFSQMFGKVLADNVGWGIDTATAGPTTRVRVDTSGGVGQTKNFGNALDNTWRRLTVILDSGNIDLFLNENQTIDSTYTHGTGLSTVQPVNMGRRSNNTNYYEGFLDEARIASTTLSADWLAIEYDNISATSSFYTTIGSEETFVEGNIFLNNASTTNFMIINGSSTAPSLLSVSGHHSNSGSFDANVGTTTFNGTSEQNIGGTLTGSSTFSGLEITNVTASTTFTAAASSTATLTAVVPGSRIEFFAGATTTAQNISIAGASGSEVYLHSSTPATLWNFEVPGDRSVSYANVKDSNACYVSGNNITASNSTDGGGGNTCWSITAPSSPGTLTLANHDVGQESNKFLSLTLTDEEFFNFKLTPATEAITTTLVFSISVSGIVASDITNAQLFADYGGDGAIAGSDEQIGSNGTVSLTGNSGTITFSSFSSSTAMNYILQADVANVIPGVELTVSLNKAKITATGDTSAQSITPTGTANAANHLRLASGGVGGSSKPDAVPASDQGGGTGGGAPSGGGSPPPDQGGGGSGGGGRSQIQAPFLNFASVITALGTILSSIWDWLVSFF